MASRVLVIIKSKAFIVVASLVALYALAGFILAPYLLSRFVPSYVKQQLQRQTSIGEVRVNPFLLTLEVNDLDLKEADGRPLASLQRLFVDFELESLFGRAWTFSDIVLERPSMLLEIDHDGRVNWATLADSFPKSEGPPAPEAAVPRILLRHVVLSKGHFTFSDRPRANSAAAALQAIELEFSNVSTLPEGQGPYVLTAELVGGGKLAWNGEISLQPMNSIGRFDLTGLPLATVWPFSGINSISRNRKAPWTWVRSTGSPKVTARSDLACRTSASWPVMPCSSLRGEPIRYLRWMPCVSKAAG